MLSKELEISLNHVFKEAKEKHYEYFTVEHLLLSLLDEPSVFAALKACGANLTRLHTKLSQFISTTTPLLSATEVTHEPQPSLGFQRVLQRALFQVQSSGKMEVQGINVLVAMFGEQDSQAIYFLKQEHVTRIDILNYLMHGITKMHHEHDDKFIPINDEEPLLDAVNTSILEMYTTNLNTKALANRIDPLIGRREQLERVIQILSRRRKNNPLLVGEAGVGKTAIAEGLAQAIVQQHVPVQLINSTIYSLDLGSLLAGTKYRGDFEKRLKLLLSQLKQEAKSILLIDEIHTIIGAGAASGGVMDASNLIKPFLANGELRCIGTTTYQEYRGIFEKDRALARRFQKVDVSESSVPETIEILSGLKSRLELHHKVHYTTAAVRASAKLASRYLPDRFLPDKAIDIMDEAGAYQNMQPKNKRKQVIGVNEIENMLVKMARIPPRSISISDKDRLKHLEDDLRRCVFGQDKAIDSLCAAIKLTRSGLREANKTIGSFLLAGPTGVGKTEMSQQLAKVMGIELIRFDMSEYMERHTVSRLIGAPPGYIGYDQGGLLTEAINKHPHAVLLLDEIEKAHPDVFNLLLQVMDHGRLTDTNGRTADFRHIILIMTTNAGAEELARQAIGFRQENANNTDLSAIKHTFSIEFRNRLDAIILFDHLNPMVVTQVLDKYLMELETQLEAKRIHFSVESLARQWLVDHGYDRVMGARPMARLIQEKIKKPLANELLFGQLARGGTVLLTVSNEQLRLVVNMVTVPC